MNARLQYVIAAAAALLAAIGAGSAAAQEEPAAAKTCVYLPDVDHTKIVDEHNILFYLRNHTILQNSLREACYGLHPKTRFAYGGVSLKRLCTGNTITVLADLSYGGVAGSNSCRLGMFLPVSQDEVDDLLSAASKDKAQKKQAIKSEPVELPPDSAREAPPKTPPTESAAPAPPPAEQAQH